MRRVRGALNHVGGSARERRAAASRVVALELDAASVFLGLFIPTGVGGDVYRIARVRGSGAGLARGTATILLERAVGLLALLLLLREKRGWTA